ncbi:MAG: efflux RND transporter permease subunit, partial [Flavobacteriales bacterium]|nr:efflux RND transporter permease subunit [Flavobacteriales bacterium]
IWVRYADEDRTSVAQLSQVRIRTVNGLEVPLDEVAELDVKRGVVAINRLYGKREIQVSADLGRADVSATDANADIRENVVPQILASFPTVTASYEGQNREVGKSQRSMAKIMPIIFLLMLFVIILTFRSPLQGLAVFMLIPFGLIGVVVGHWVMGAQISFFSILGIIALIGILVNDALVFVSSFNLYIRQGMEFKKAIYETGLSRFRPILLTSVTTIAGLGPLLFNKSFQAQFLIPMAISVAFGLLFITLIILILLPVFLRFINPMHGLWVWITKGKYPPVELREPAMREIVGQKEFSSDEDE